MGRYENERYFIPSESKTVCIAGKISRASTLLYFGNGQRALVKIVL